jgi:hypothetical protein
MAVAAERLRIWYGRLIWNADTTKELLLLPRPALPTLLLRMEDVDAAANRRRPMTCFVIMVLLMEFGGTKGITTGSRFQLKVTAGSQKRTIHEPPRTRRER